jgi:hypothetical protein
MDKTYRKMTKRRHFTLFALGSGRSVSGTVGAFSASSRYDVSSSKARSSPKASSSETNLKMNSGQLFARALSKMNNNRLYIKTIYHYQQFIPPSSVM